MAFSLVVLLVVQFLVALIAIRRARRALAQLRASESRYHALCAMAPVTIFRTDAQGRRVYLSPQWEALTGAPPAEVLGDGWIQYLHPEDRQQVLSNWETALAQRSNYGGEYRFRHRNGETRWVIGQAVPELAPDGGLAGFVGTLTDITPRKQMEEALRHSEEHYRRMAQSNQLLVSEVNHRVRNNLASLMGLVRLTRRRAGSVEEFSQAIEDRLAAMAQIHNMLAHANWGELDLKDMLLRLSEVVQRWAPHRIPLELDGPAVKVQPGQSLALALAVLELFNNSIKHGAHRSPDGRLRIRWTVQGDQSERQLVMRWTESGGPPVAAPVTPSLGSELIGGFVSFELGGRFDPGYGPDGVDHTIQFAL